ncbi:MAG: oligosaccharide flippase family protein [Cryomorphaceae bacterium]|jgi:O-antigen/teichoic acid export membrane protein|nr:oligosaccharide flippase family protein [Cryomorphaceae bacterium]
MKISKGFLRSMGIYTFSNIVNAGIPFLLLPVLTTYLTTEDYGILSNFNALANVMIPLIGINLMSSVQVQFLKEEVDFKSYVSTGFYFNILLTLFFSLILIGFSGKVSHWTGVPTQFLVFALLYGLFNTVIEVLLAVWRMEDKSWNYGIFRIGRTMLEIALVFILVIVFRLNFSGSIYALFWSYLIATFVAVFILVRKQILWGLFRQEYLSHVLRYGAPLIPHSLSAVAIMYADKLILTHYHGLSANGIYSVGFMVGQLIGLLQNSFNQAWVPWVFQKLKNGDQADKVKMVKLTYVYIVAILVAVVLLWLVLPWIYMLFGKDFQQGREMVLWVALGFAFNGMYKMVSVYIFYLEKTGLIALNTVLAALLNVTLSFSLIPAYGAMGAAYAQLISMFVLFVGTWLISARLMNMPWIKWS